LAVSITIGTPDSARIARHTSMPSMPGQHQVQQHQVGLVLAEHRHRLVAVRAQRGLVALAAQHDAEHLGQRRVVVDDQHPALHPRTLMTSS
jgi:hypothetical protein